MTFDIQQLAYSAFWQAEIIIYNANGPISTGPSAGINLMQAVIQEGDTVTLSAGYQADYPYPSIPPSIWTGPIFYTIQDKLDVVDDRLIIHCLLNRILTTQNFINENIPPLSSQFSQAQLIASKCANPIGMHTGQVQQAFSSANPQRGSSQLPRGKSYFGNPHRYLSALADQNSLLSWFDNHSWNVDSLQNPVGTLIATYAPVNIGGGPPQIIDGIKLSLIGQPQQTQFGVSFRVLLDPTVQVRVPLPQVAVQLQYVRQAPIQYPLPKGKFAPVPLSSKYVVVGVRFIGDTRGNPWYSDITAVVQIQTAIQMLGQSTQADPTGN